MRLGTEITTPQQLPVQYLQQQHWKCLEQQKGKLCGCHCNVPDIYIAVAIQKIVLGIHHSSTATIYTQGNNIGTVLFCWTCMGK
jgi:hypothetical protein